MFYTVSRDIFLMIISKKSVTQEDSLGCGIACVAFVCNVSYKTAKKKYFKNLGDADKTGYFCKDIVKALSNADKMYNYKYIKRKIRLKTNTIVFLKRSKRYPAGHYLVRTINRWMDPWINFNIDKPNVKEANSGFRSRLPGKPIYVVFPL